MGPVLLRLRAEFRSRWRAWLGLALLLGIFGGAVLAVTAGGRRTDTAYPRFLESKNAYHVGLFDFGTLEGFAHLDFDQVAKLPQVETAVEVRFYGNEDIGIAASPDERLGTTFNAVKILEGRRPNPDSVEEVTVGFLAAEQFDLHVGDVIDTELRTQGEVPFEPVPIRIRIVGINAAPGEFPPLLDTGQNFLGTPAFHARYGYFPVPNGVFIRLRNGDRDGPAFSAELEKLSPNDDVILRFFQSEHARNVERSFHLQAIALWLLAAFAAAGILLIFGQTLRRHTILESSDYPIMRSLGMTHLQLVGVGIVRSTSIALAGAVIAAVVASLASPFFPTGIPRIAEPDPGFAIDATLLALGPPALVALVLLITAPAVVRAARRAGDSLGFAELEPPSSKPSFADGLARSGLPATTVAGVRLALEPGRGRTAVPVRSMIAGVTLGIAALAAALSFDASLNHLLDTPEEYGLRWNALVNGPFGEDQRGLIEPALAIPGVDRVAAGSYGVPLEIDGKRVDGLALDDADGSGLLRIIEGSGPRARDEIVLGTNTLEALGKRIGDSVSVTLLGTEPKTLRVVGRAVVPPIGEQGHFGEGAILDHSALLYVVPEGPDPETLFVSFKPDADPSQVLAALRQKVAAPARGIVVDEPDLPEDLVNFGRVQNLPVILAGMLALLAGATLAHVLITSIRRRRRDLAVLKTMGFVRRQIHASVAWQATTLAAVAALVGVPLGIIGGRSLWTLFANELGVESRPQSALTLNLIVIPVSLLLANLISLWPGRSAARTKPALVLRTE